jgi:hypothetical protein
MGGALLILAWLHVGAAVGSLVVHVVDKEDTAVKVNSRLFVQKEGETEREVFETAVGVFNLEACGTGARLRVAPRTSDYWGRHESCPIADSPHQIPLAGPRYVRRLMQSAKQAARNGKQADAERLYESALELATLGDPELAEIVRAEAKMYLAIVPDGEDQGVVLDKPGPRTESGKRPVPVETRNPLLVPPTKEGREATVDIDEEAARRLRDELKESLSAGKDAP